MYVYELNLRVRYAETDQMQYVYYGNYATYFEVARVEALRNLGYSYKKLEQEGVMMPVLENFSKFIRPARYDDLLRICVRVEEWPTARMRFDYEIYNEENTLLHIGYTLLVFVSTQTMRPVRCPETMTNLLENHFNK